MKKILFIIILVLCSVVVLGGMLSCTSYTSTTSILVDSVALSGLKFDSSKVLDIKQIKD